MNDSVDPTQEDIEALTSLTAFHRTYRKVRVELDALHKGHYDEAESQSSASLCLLSMAALIPQQSAAELRARSLKRDIDFKKAEVYLEMRNSPPDGKKLTEAALTSMVTKDQDVHQLYLEQGQAEKEAKELNNVLALLKDAHITFRALVKKGQ